MAASRRWLWSGLTCTLLGAPGCSSAHLLSQVRALSQKVDELSRLQKEATLKQEDIENRVFLLSDQMESQKVAQFVRGDHRNLKDLVEVQETNGPREGSGSHPLFMRHRFRGNDKLLPFRNFAKQLKN